MEPDQDERIEELSARLEELHKVVEDNHRMMEKVYRSMVLNRIIRIVYWVLVLGAAVGAFYFLQPYLDTISGSYNRARELFGGTSTVSALLFAR
jgi:hypothetical protein